MATLSKVLLRFAAAALVIDASAKETWIIGAYENYRIYSNASERRTESIIENLREVRSALASLFPRYAERDEEALRIYVCRNQATVSKFSSLFEGKPKRIKGLFHRDFDGSYIVIDAGGDFASTRRIVFHEYVHFLLQSREYQLPAWLNEGLAETFSTIESRRSKIKVGLADAYNLAVLSQERMIPLDRFFLISNQSPEYNSAEHGRTIFYAQSWAITHYLLFGDSGFTPEQRAELLNAAIELPWLAENEFRRIAGFGFAELKSRLETYVDHGKYATITLPQVDSAKRIDIGFRQASDAEVDLVYGKLLLNRREPDDAFPYLYRAYNGLPGSAEAAAWRGYLDIKREAWDLALKWLEQSVALQPDSSGPYLHYARSYLKVAIPNDRVIVGAFGKDTTSNLLSALLKARELGESGPQLYQYAGTIWACSTVEASESDMELLYEGRRLYPEDSYIGYLIAHLHFENGRIDAAAAIADQYLSRRIDPHSKGNFENLKQRIAAKKAPYSP